jgi:uncharacterized membrane protein (UPF0127 family)
MTVSMKWIKVAVLAVILSAPGSSILSGRDTSVTWPVDLKTAQGEHRIMVELAQSPQARAQGLMFRRELAEGHGMLFIYDCPLIPAFWMKNMFLTIDIIFIGQDRQIKKIFSEVPPCPAGQICETYSPSEPVVYVLEVPGGFSGKIGLQPGDLFQFDQVP